MRLAYLVSRFPVATETFIVRELNAVEAELGEPIELLSLFPPGQPFVHPAAERWVPRLRQASWPAAIRGAGWALLSRPRRLAAALLATLRGYWRRPARLVRALITLPLAAGHARELERLRIEHVHAHWANYPTLAAWMIGRLTGIPYSFTCHAHDIFIDQSNLGTLIDGAEFVVTISEYNRAFLRRYGSGEIPIHVVRVAIDVDRIVFRPRRPPEAGPVRALCVARLTEYKGHKVLLQALAHGGPLLDRLEVDLVGAGPLAPALREFASDLGIGPRIHFLGTKTENELRDLYDRADLFVLPSLVGRSGDQEGLPTVMLEALASGCPAVGTATAGTPEILREEATCLLATPGDPVSLVAALEHVLSEPDAALVRAERGRKLVEQHYSADRAAREMVSLFKSGVSAERK